MDPDDRHDAKADSVADLEAMWDATPAAVTVLSAPAGRPLSPADSVGAWSRRALVLFTLQFACTPLDP